MHIISNSTSSELLWFTMMLVSKTPIYTMLSKLPARSEMAELSEPARENCELQKAILVLYSLLIKYRENGSVLTRGKVFVIKDLLPPWLTHPFSRSQHFLTCCET